jgi:hypothetical protein
MGAKLVSEVVQLRAKSLIFATQHVKLHLPERLGVFVWRLIIWCWIHVGSKFRHVSGIFDQFDFFARGKKWNFHRTRILYIEQRYEFSTNNGAGQCKHEVMIPSAQYNDSKGF